MEQERLDEAMAQFQKVLSLESKHTLASYQLGLVYYQKGMFAQALASLRDALKVNKDDISPISLHIMLAATYAAMNEFEQALQEYRDALKLEPNNSDLQLGMGDLYFQQGKYDEALAHFKKTSKNDANARMYLAKGYWFKGERAKSISILQEAASDFPENPEIQAYLGHLQLEMGNYNEAIRHLQKAIDLDDPINEDVLLNLGDAYYWAGDLDKSLELCKHGTGLFSDNVFFYRRIGFIYEKQGNLEAALKTWQRMTEIDQTDADAHHILALGYRSNGNLEIALREIEQTILLDPTSASAHNTKGIILWDLGKLKEAVPFLERAIDLGHSLSLIELAELHHALGNADKAIYYAKTLIKAAEENPELQIGIEAAMAILNELQSI